MRLTRRGKAVLVVALSGLALAWLFGARSLNAVVLPAAIALIAAVLQVGTLDAPSVTRDVPPDGFPGDTGTVTLSFDVDSPFGGTVSDQLSDGLSGDPVVETTVGATPATYEVTYDRRGAHDVGLVSVTAQDVLGLAETELTVPGQDTVLVYPTVHDVAPWAGRALRALYDVERSQERDEFDRLREYERGDALRDIHWRSSAKRDDLVVKEFAADSMTDAVSLTAGARAGYEDEMAEAAASVAAVLVTAGIPVTLTTPDGRISAGGSNLTPILEHLAMAGRGEPPTPDADVTVFADRETEVGVGGEVWSFEAMCDAAPGTQRRGTGERDGDATEVIA
jgi:uncharacterized protein (DUF58 family)